jgi:hypothetical protein
MDQRAPSAASKRQVVRYFLPHFIAAVMSLHFVANDFSSPWFIGNLFTKSG